MTATPAITLAMPSEVLVVMHLIARSSYESAHAQGLSSITDDLLAACQVIEGALRAHGWKPSISGTWEFVGPRRRVR